MNNEVFLSRFTPSLMSPEVLEQIFVQRGDLAEHLVEIVRNSVLTPAKHHKLVLGPRGIGKTHLLSLVRHRIAGQEDLQDRIRIAWLREEEWGVSSFLDLLHRILRTLSDTYEDEDLQAQTEKLFSVSTRVAERRAGELLRSFLGGRTLVLLTENLDDLFDGLGKKEQHRFRAYLQEEASWTIVATAQGLFAGVQLHESPFYGFFETHHLQELSVDDAARLVMNIARLSNNEDLAGFVQTPDGRARIRAIHHLAGGNHRIYVILSEFLTRESLDELVDPFLKAMDDLTPYYQARMAQLSSQQRKIIDFLCDTRGAVPVKQIANRCFMTPQTASSQLKDLRDKGYVRSTPIGRDAYYELTEPLMRIALEVKKQRESPVRLFLDFLRYWYSPDELVERLAHAQAHSLLERDYLQQVLQDSSNPGDDNWISDSVAKFEQQLATKEYAAALMTAEHLVELRSDASNWCRMGRCLIHLDRYGEAVDACDRALAADQTDTGAWFWRITALTKLRRVEEALTTIEQAVLVEGWSDELKGTLYLFRGILLVKLNRLHDAMDSFYRGVQLTPDVSKSRRERGKLLQLLGRHEEAAAIFERMIEDNSMETQDWGSYALTLEKLERYEESVASFDRQLASETDAHEAWVNRGRVLRTVGRHYEAIESFNRATQLRPDDSTALLEMGYTYNLLGEVEQALEAFQAAYQRKPDHNQVRLTVIRQLLALSRNGEALHLIGSPDVTDPEQHLLLFVKAWACWGLNQEDEGVAILSSLLEIGSAATANRAMVAALLFDLTRFRGDEHARRHRAILLIEVYRKYDAASQLGAGLVAAIPILFAGDSNRKAAVQWVAMWKNVAGSFPELQMPLRLLEAAVEYRETSDERVLLALPVEEREILQGILKDIPAIPEVRERRRSYAGSRKRTPRRKR